uniref:Protein Vpu n=1 Tax=Human immunodeficiency virus type 1 TaxID=11676 RepID=A0A4P8W3V7_HV1|nr:vpu protein [Human immunodeficiency virus 1]
MSLAIIAVVIAFIVAIISAIIVWTVAYVDYKKVLRQRRINRLYGRIIERADDSGNESEGDAEELAELGEVGPFIPGDINNL